MEKRSSTDVCKNNTALSLYFFSLVMNTFTKCVQCEASRCNLFINNMVLVDVNTNTLESKHVHFERGIVIRNG